MKKYFFKIQVSFLLILQIFNYSCNGQSKKNTTDLVSSTDKITSGHSKILKSECINAQAIFGYSMQDKTGNIWFCSNGAGVYRYDGKSFTNFTEKDGLDNNVVYSILEDKSGNIWIGTKTGLNRYDGKKITKVPIILNGTYDVSFNSSHSQSGNPPLQNAVWSMMLDLKGTIWFGTGHGVYCYNGISFTSFIDNRNVINKDTLHLKAIFSILEDKAGSIWFTACVSEGISRFDGKSLTNIIPYDQVGRTDRMIQDKKGNLWFACVFKGLGFYDGKTFTKNMFKEKSPFGPSNVLEDTKGNIWFDTQKGLGFYDGKTLRILTEKDGLPNKNISPLLKDAESNLWFTGSNMNLYKYNGKTFTDFTE